MSEMHVESKREALDAACRLASQASAENGRAVLLVATYDDVVRAKHVLAERDLGYGIDVETPTSWIGDLWEMFGDGRRIATNTQVALFVRLALKQYREACAEVERTPLLELTAGTERLILNVLEAAPGQVVSADKTPELFELTPAQQAAVHVAAEARRRMAREGMIVRARSCNYLANAEVVSGLHVVVLDCDTQLFEEELLAQTHCTTISSVAETATYDERAGEINELIGQLRCPDFGNPVMPTGVLRFVYPSGEYASNQLLADEIECSFESAQEGDCVQLGVASAEPLRLFDALAPRLLAKGASVRSSGMANFRDTPFGRAWSALVKYVLDEGKTAGNVHSAGDFALSAFSAMGVREAFAADAALRSWRGESIEDGLADIKRFTKESWQEFIVAVESKDFIAALDAQARWVQGHFNWTEGFRVQQANAITVAKSIHQGAEALGLTPLDALEVLQEIMLPYEVCAAPENGEPRAEITMGTLAQLAGHDPYSFDSVFLTHVDVNRYPLKDEENATDTLLQALDSWKPARRIEKLRLRFVRCIALARSRIVIHRALNDEEANKLRPSALLEELLDCYCFDPSNADELDKTTGLPKRLMEFCATSGEDDLARLLDAKGEREGEVDVVELAPVGEVSAKAAQKIEPVSLSASALELYVACPHKWFVNRRLDLEGIDAEMGSLSRGNCAHTVLERVHSGLVERGEKRVTRDNLEACQTMAREEFARYVEEQSTSRDPNAYFPMNEMERLDCKRFREQLCDYLEWEADLLPAFSLGQQEFKFGFDDDETEYAGVKVCGSVDRIDVDDAGNAVIIDYKGSAKQEYGRYSKNTLELLTRAKDGAGGETVFVLPERIQALMYAQIVRRKLGLNPVAALYVSYGKKHEIAGAYEHAALREDVDLLGIKADRCAVTDFLGLLDDTESAIARCMERMKAGDIMPCPYTSDACNYCSVVQCAFREGASAKGRR